MASDSFFLTKTTVPQGSMLDVDGVPAVEQYQALADLLFARGGRSVAALFAEPVLSIGNGNAPTTVSWYTSFAGEGVRLSSLQATERHRVEDLLRQRLGQARGLLDDPVKAPLLGAALHVLEPRDVWVVDGQPVIVNWAMLPDEVQRSQSSRDAHFAATLGSYLALPSAPPLSAAEWQEQAGESDATRDGAVSDATGAPSGTHDLGRQAAAGGVEGAAAGAAAAGTQREDRGGTVLASMPVVTDGGARWRWIPLVLLLILLLVLLVWLLLPGTLLYPEASRGAALDDAGALALAREANATLEQRVEQLRRAADGAVCSPQGELILPDGRTPIGLPPAQSGALESGPAPGAPDSLFPPPPAQLAVPQDAIPSTLPEPGSLIDLLEQSTALVVAVGQNSTGHGTGFFISPNLLVTNHHVAAVGAQGGKLFVTSKRLGGLKQGRLLASSGPLEQTGADYAVIEVHDAPAMPYYVLRDSSATMKLQNVIAAGYPSVILESDANFEALMSGDATAIPDMVVTQGIVNVEQQIGPQTRVVVHTASISPGNSGGPLVDSCGRVVGVNTFGRLEKQTMRRVNFALDSHDLIGFLQSNGIAFQSSAQACQPAVNRTAEAAPAGDDGAAAAGEGVPPAPAGGED